MTLKPSARVRPVVVVTLAVLAALVSGLALTARAEAFVYWTNAETPPCTRPDTGGLCGPAAIARANLDGTGVADRFIDVGPSQSIGPTGVAVDAEHIYWGASCHPWAPCATGAIGRANLDGTNVDQDFITTGAGLGAIAVDADHLYWSQGERIVRADLDGTGVDPNFITTGGCPGDVAIGANHVYWTNTCDSNFYAGAVGRADLDGTNVNPNFIPGDRIFGVAVDANHVYWPNSPDWDEPPNYPAAIGRANLDGTEIDRRFIPNLAGPGDAYGPAVDATHIYWGQSISGIKGIETWISRATLDGTLDSGFQIPTERHAGLAVDALTDTELVGDVTAAKIQKQHGNAIVVKVEVSADERLTAEASGKIKVNPSYKLKRKKIELTADETITLKLKPKKAQARKIATFLRRGESATAKLKVKLSDFAAHSEVEKLSVRLKR
jgi:virginiamycin B lyase